MSGFKVKIITAEGSQTIRVAKSHLLIGHAEHCDIQLSGGEVAAEHLRIWSDGHHLWGQDLGSAFVTTLNGQPLQPMRPILFHESDSFGLSDATLAFHPAQSGMIRAPAVHIPIDARIEAPPEVTEQLRLLTEANLGLKAEVERWREEAERHLRGSSVVDAKEEEEISAVKHNALQEIQAMKEAEVRRFEVWKRESVEGLEDLLIKTIRRHSSWKASLEDLCEEVAQTLRFSLLNEKPLSRRRRTGPDSFQRALLGAVMLGFLAVATFYYVHVSARRSPSSVVFIPAPSKQQFFNSSTHPVPLKKYNK